MTQKCGFEIEIPLEERRHRREEIRELENYSGEPVKTSPRALFGQKEVFKFSDKELIRIWKTRNKSSRSYYLWNNQISHRDKLRLTHLRCLKPELMEDLE